MTSLFVPMASTVAVLAVVIVIISVAAHQFYERSTAKKRQSALHYILSKTQGYYFYGQQLSECLQIGIGGELYLRDIGDFSKQLGVLVLCALNDATEQPRMYCRWRESSSDIREGHYSVLIRYQYGGDWWQINMAQALNIYTLQEVKVGRKSSELGAEYVRCLNFWSLDEEQRCVLKGCADPKMSNLMPETRYIEAKSEEEYTNLVSEEIEKVLDFWYFSQDDKME